MVFPTRTIAVIAGDVTCDVTDGVAFGVQVGGGATVNIDGLTTVGGGDVGGEGRLWIGATAGGTGTATVSLSGAINVAGGTFNPTEGEWHGFDIGGGCDVVVVFEAGVVVTTSMDVGLGKADRWVADYATDITFEAGATLDNTGSWTTFGLGGDDQVLTMKDGSAILGTYFQVGGTLEIDGSVFGASSRFRNYSPDPETILKPLSDGSVFNTTGIQMQNGGVRIDTSAVTTAAYDWNTVGCKVQISLMPEPATMLLLGLGVVGLLRKRR